MQEMRLMEEIVQKARDIAVKALSGEVRSDGTPFIGHADNVAAIVENELGLPAECVAAVYLHEATRAHKDLSIAAFPKDVQMMVDGLNKISTIKPKDTRLEAENYKKLIVQYSTDPRVAVIKIADRLEVMRSLSIFPKALREQKILETLMLYIPIAHQLGLYNIKQELEEIYFRFAEPVEYRSISNKLKATEGDREKLMTEFIKPLEQKLDDAGIKYKLKIRTKTAYSIYRKMQLQNVPFEGVYDVFAIRFIIDCEPDPVLEKDLCWKVYGYVTEEYEPDTSRLRDWLTTPRPNGYESLHITVKNSRGAYVEVQIRTARMDYEAENGNAAHWAYKGVQHEANLDRWLASVRYALENPASTKPEDLPLPPNREIFVFTPTGELRILPAGASVLDFAFNIHSNVGIHCLGGMINGKGVSIKEKLCTGDTVEIMTGKNQHPTRQWLDWVITSKARSKIKQELDAEERKLAALGKELLERRLRNWKLEWPDEFQTEFMKSRKYSSVISLLADIGRESLDANDIKAFILKKKDASPIISEHETIPAIEHKPAYVSGKDDILVLNAKNVRGMEYKLAKCCNPVFGDDVFGFVTRTEGIKIHRISCPNAERLISKYPYRIQKVIWQESASSGDFQAKLNITAESDQAVLSRITEVVGAFRASLRSLSVNENTRGGTYEINLRLLVPSNTELDKIISQIGKLKHVLKVKRI